ncbi:MAG: hypothetical protein WBM41_00975 [Arenicellales bacterium]
MNDAFDGMEPMKRGAIDLSQTSGEPSARPADWFSKWNAQTWLVGTKKAGVFD